MLADRIAFDAPPTCRRPVYRRARALGLRGVPLASRRHSGCGGRMTATDPQYVAVLLHDWFESILHLTEESLFSFVPEGPHRDAVVLDTLKRNARILSQASLDHEGKL